MHEEYGTSPRNRPQLERRRLTVRGVVQGVGFRPFVYRLAQELDLSGWVRNDGSGVELEAQGTAGNLSALVARLHGEAPPLASIERLDSSLCELDPNDRGFTISASQGGSVTTSIAHDSAVCDECLHELFDPTGRRWRHPFINCTQCGPRYTITRGLPYDRVSTSMAAFAQCPECADEYRNPLHRRFHAEPNACPACGPRLSLLEAYGVTVASHDPIADTLLRLLCGEIVAVKGLGGYHLMCDARNPEAVDRLRQRKSRDDKPFAIMVANTASARHWAQLGAVDESLLGSPERPVVLCDKRDTVDAELHGVAPGLAWIGLMLPYTPLHYLLFHDFAGRPAGTGWLRTAQELALVCTSANPGGEPLVTGDREATRRLMGIADAYLFHDREIVVRCDDSVVRSLPAARAGDLRMQFVRRSRGYTPRALRLADKGEPVMAFGGLLKNTLCMTRGDEAFLSQHVGDLSSAGACQALDEVASHLQHILTLTPVAVAHDLNPDFPSTLAAEALAERLGIPAFPVQHHHAHIAAVQAEHRHQGPILGLALDGSGLGTDGKAWGGELLQVDGAHFNRLGHLAPLRQPDAGKSEREPWRMASSVLHRLGRGDEIADRFHNEAASWRMHELLEAGTGCPPTTSLGRWFDAAAGLLGVCERMGYEGEAAMRLESLATRFGGVLPMHQGWQLTDSGDLDLLPLLSALADEHNPARGASLFHATLATALESWVLQAVDTTGIRSVALSGGCFLNRLLSRDLSRRLSARGLDVLEARQVPPNDGGLALGQAHVARHILHHCNS
ncbi:carbamoyltransferase HypF [Parazoarcus communis]|uniref:Carbamoyltransferase HypF n=1 Tax=Parazoarcus communis TaxID=41977 RepID=A0A2U8H446_9RHOO|nr:carbamoyltransferase HypF [Parazoarcus communis]AWI79575.1 carbamoyltransferase HypF [Parazoarcus communis]